MKRTLLMFALAAGTGWTACNETKTDTTSSDSSVSASTGNTTDNANNEASTAGSTSFDESASYVDLKTNKPVRLKRKEGAQELVNYETNEPYSYFFYNPATRDTFDRSGHVVNNYLIRTDDGNYSLDEERWRVKRDSDGDVKMKDGDESKIKYDASSGELKVKTEDTTIKYKPKQ